MTLKVKKDGAWKEASSLKVKINGEWKDVSTLYSRKDGAWVTVYSSGALITFTNYPYPIPVAKGWKYSTDKVNWTTVTSDSTINESGTFTGFIKANSITLSDYSTVYVPAESGRMDGEALSDIRDSMTSFTNGDKGYVCGGYRPGNSSTAYLSIIEVYDSTGNKTSGTQLSVGRSSLTSFTNVSKGYVCGGATYRSGAIVYSSVVDIYDSSGNRTTGESLSVARADSTSFVIGSRGYVCGGINGKSNNTSSYQSAVDIYDSSGTRTTGISLSTARCQFTSFINNSKGYVCGGYDNSYRYSTVDVYDSSGNRTTGANMSVGRHLLTSFANKGNGYVCGGMNNSAKEETSVDVYDSSGNRTNGVELRVSRYSLMSFVNADKGYVCGGYHRGYLSTVDIYDSSGNRTTGESLSVARAESATFSNGGKGYVCGGQITNSSSSAVDVYYDIPESYSTKLPITEGSTYTLNGESGTANVSKVMEFDSKVSGTIKYKTGDMSPSVRITVVDENGNVVEGATISINPDKYSVLTLLNGSYPSGTSVTATPSSANPGEEITILCSGVGVAYLSSATRSDGGSIKWSGSLHEGTFTMPECDVIITIKFTAKPS